MKHEFDESRRRLLKRVSLGVALAPIAGAALRPAWAAALSGSTFATNAPPGAASLKESAKDWSSVWISTPKRECATLPVLTI